MSDHRYQVSTRWTGNTGRGTSTYRSYSRAHEVSAAGLPVILGSADRTFHGDASRWNPEQLLLAALSQCHMLSYLHAATTAGVVVVGYTDEAEGLMTLNPDGSGQFAQAMLRPVVTLAPAEIGEDGTLSDSALLTDPAALIGLAQSLHAEAAAKCFIARSVNFPVRHEPRAELTAPSDVR